jgi:hypothetical protein
MSTICRHFYVVKFPKHCNVSSSAKRPTYAQLKFLVWTVRFGETEMTGTTFKIEINTYIRHILTKLSVLPLDKLNTSFESNSTSQFLPMYLSKIYSNLTQLCLAILLLRHFMQIWLYKIVLTTKCNISRARECIILSNSPGSHSCCWENQNLGGRSHPYTRKVLYNSYKNENALINNASWYASIILQSFRIRIDLS